MEELRQKFESGPVVVSVGGLSCLIVTVLGLVGGAPAQGWGGDTARGLSLHLESAAAAS
jgi:hypothetical protein